MVECKLVKTKDGSYRIFLPKLLMEEITGIKDTCMVDVWFYRNKVIITKKESKEFIDVDEDVKVVE